MVPEKMKALALCRKGDDITFGVREIPAPTIADPKDIIIKVEACPINPSDHATIGTVAMAAGGPDKVVAGDGPGTVSAPASDALRARFKDRVMQVVGNEGCGTVVAAGESAEAQALVGKRVALTTGKNYAQYIKYQAGAGGFFTVLPDDCTPLDGASVFVNPMTAMGFLQTARGESHEGMIITAAGSQLGRMIIRMCKRESFPCVCIVRSDKAVEALKALGAEHVIVSSHENFKTELKAAIVATKATVAFDCIGGGDIAGIILEQIQAALYEIPGEHIDPSYGPSKFRALYKYGALDRSPTSLPPSVGVGNFVFGGWLMANHYKKYGMEKVVESMTAVATHLKTDFTTTYGKHLTLDDVAASPEAYMASLATTTDEKFLITPNGPVV